MANVIVIYAGLLIPGNMTPVLSVILIKKCIDIENKGALLMIFVLEYFLVFMFL